MKTFRLAVTFLMGVMCAGFISCDKEENDETFTDDVASKRIKEIRSINGNYPYTITFDYSGDKLIKYTWIYDDEPFDYEFNQSITYSGNRVIMTGEVDGKECTQTYILNNKGYASSCSYIREGYNVEITFAYSSDDYLIKTIEIESKDTQTRTNTCNFTYKAGNITEGKDSDISGYIFTANYSNQPNRTKIMNYIMSELLYNYQTAYYCGILGKHCKSLSNSCYQTETYPSGWSQTYNFIHIMDEDNCVSQTILATDNKSETLTYAYE